MDYSVKQDFVGRADKLLNTVAGSKDPLLKDYWIKYGHYITTLFVVTVLVFNFQTGDIYSILHSFKTIAVLGRHHITQCLQSSRCYRTV
jgi:hypothetical protein